ncbi:hypothetical protein B0H19DRAFT_1083959 [Mycena capillaripes]|nr:hypothetical protein B0H19DRAFT_1083959 [Mycena capillaripes]
MGSVLSLRTPVDTLKQKYPELANELIFLSAQRSSLDLECEFAYIPSELWVQLIQPVLDALAITLSWWYPIGPLTSLPIPAAGIYGEDVTLGSKLSDFVIS